MDAMVELELYDELKQVFHVEKKYQEEGVWYNFIRGVYNPNANYSQDSLLIYLTEGEDCSPIIILLK